MNLNAREFKKAVLDVCKAIPCHKQEYLNLYIKRGHSDMIIYISQPLDKDKRRYFYAEYPCFDVRAIIHNVENPERLSCYFPDPHVIEGFLKIQKYSRNEKISIQIRMSGLLFSMAGLSENIFFTSYQIGTLELLRLKLKRSLKIHVENFSYYFKETKHILCRPASYKNELAYFLLEVDTEDNIMVATTRGNCIAARGDIKEPKYEFFLPKAEMLRAVAILGDDVTIRINQNSDYIQMASGNLLVAMPLLRPPFNYKAANSTYLKSFGKKPLLSFTVLREKLLKHLKMVMVIDSENAVLSLKKNKLQLSALDKTSGANITTSQLHIEGFQQDTEVSLKIHVKYLYDALRSINSINVCIEYIPLLYIRVTDYHINSRRLPHSLSATEIIWSYNMAPEALTSPEAENGNSELNR